VAASHRPVPPLLTETPLSHVCPTLQSRKEDDGPRVPPWVVYFFMFIVIGGAVFQILQSAMNGSPLSE
jgi:hypothetical protein